MGVLESGPYLKETRASMNNGTDFLANTDILWTIDSCRFFCIAGLVTVEWAKD